MELNDVKEKSGKCCVEEFSVVDEDNCSHEEIDRKFPNRYVAIKNVKVCSGDVSCSRLLAESSCRSNFANVLSDRSIAVVDKGSFKVVNKYNPHNKEVTDVKFSPQNPHLIYTSSLNGNIIIWDSRSNNCEKTIDTNTKVSKKPITTFDISENEKLLCAGTELIGSDSFLLFWDIRGDKLLGGYWESHSDDITCVKFNPDNPKLMVSSSLDNLVNVFDVSHSTEDDALTYSLNTEDIVDTFTLRTENRKVNLLCHTDVHSIQLWDIEEASPSVTFSRETLTKALRRTKSYECYPIPMNNLKFSKNPVILAGSGLEHETSSCLRTLKVDEKTKTLEPHGLFVSEENCIPSVVQVALYNADVDEFITVREDGVISLWKNSLCDAKTFKVKSNRLSNKSKPY